jgi:DNA-damage-inducible protein J
LAFWRTLDQNIFVTGLAPGAALRFKVRGFSSGIEPFIFKSACAHQSFDALLDISLPVGYNVAQEEVNAMSDNSVVRARIDERTKREAAAALKKIGLTVSDAFRLLLVRVAAEKALPFEPLNPNAETIAAMKAARRGELASVGKPDKLLRSLNEGS